MCDEDSRKRFTLSELHFASFRETREVESFDCGDVRLNDFLNTEEVFNYETEGLGETTLVYGRNHLVAYYTISLADLTVDYVKTYKSFSKTQELKVTDLPAVKIGRLAVQQKCQRRSIGEVLVWRIAAQALHQYGNSVRLLILQAYPDSIPFYERLGFQLTNPIGKEKTRQNRTMFFDLNVLR